MQVQLHIVESTILKCPKQMAPFIFQLIFGAHLLKMRMLLMQSSILILNFCTFLFKKILATEILPYIIMAMK